MARGNGIGATFQREKKKKRYTQKLTAETKERIKDKPAKAPSKSVLNSGGGSRVGTTVKNESRDKVKSVIKKAITHEVKPVSQPHLNQSLGGRVGTKTERKPLQLKTYDSGLTKREQGLKYKYKQSGTNNQFQVRGKEFSNAVKAGTFTTKFTDKEKANVAKNIQKEYEKTHKSNGRAFMAGLTGSDSNVKTRTKAITGKDIDLSKVTKKGAYKAGNVTQEVASYFIAPEEAVAGKIGSKLVEKSAAKILQKGAKNLTRKEAKAMLKEAAAKDAIKEIGGKGIAKASTKKANSKALSEAVEGITNKEVKKAVEKAGKEVVESKAKRQLARRGGDILANAPLNAKYSVDHATDEKGKVDWKAAGKDLALNTAMDVGIGGTIDAVTGKVRRAKALSSEKVAKYERKISGGKEREEIKRLAKPKEEAKGFQAVGTKAKQGKSASNTGVLDEGGIIKRQFDNIDKLENTKKITSSEAKKERKALTRAVQNKTGRTGFAYRSENGVRFGNATTKGVEHIDNSTFGRKLGFEKRFEGRANRLTKPTPEARAARAETRRIADFEAERARAVREERTANTAYNKEREPLDRYDLESRDEENRIADRTRYGKTNKEAYADEVARAQGAAKSKAAEKRRDVAIRKVLDKYMGGKDVAWSQDVIEPVKKYIKDGDDDALWRAIREQMPDFYAEKPVTIRIKQGYGRGSKRYVTKSRTMVEAGATSKDLDSMTNSLVEELKEAAAKAEPKAGADIKIPERKSRLAETDNVYDETPRTEDLYPDARKEVAQEAEKPYNNIKGEKANESGLQKGERDIRGTSERVSARQTTDRTGMEGRADTGEHGTASGSRGSVRLSDKQKARMTEGGITDTHATSTDHATFSNAINREKATNKHGGYVDPKSVEELEESGAKTFLTDDGKAGIAVTKDGDIEALFKGKDSKYKGVVNDLLITARANGGAKMDCFGKNLANKYERCGFVPVARVKFNPEYVSDPVLLKNKPDVYVMMKNTDDIDTVIEKNITGEYHLSTREELEKLPAYDDYDEALAYRNDLLKKQETAQGSKTAVTAEETPKLNNEPTRAEKGVKQSNIPETREAMEHISRKEKPSGQAKTLLKDARRKFVDSMYTLESDARKWAKVTGNKEYADAMLAEINNVRQAATQAAYSFAEEQINFNHEVVAESGQAIIQDINKKGTFEDVQAYLYYLNHADRLDAAKDSKLNKLIEQYKELEESGASPARLREIEDKMDELNDGTFGLNGETGNKRLFDDLTAEDARAKAEAIARKNPEVVQDADRIVQYFRNDLRSQVQSGLISKETAEHYMKTYPNYVPAHRADFGTGLDAKTTINPNPDALRAKGSGRNLLPIDEQMKMSTQYTFQQGANNNLKMLLAERAGMAKDTVELLEQEGKEVDPLDIATFYDADRATIKYYDNGKLKTIDLSGIEDGKEIVKDLIDQAKNGVSDPLARGVLNLLGKANRGFKALITSYSLPFMVKNFFRDVPEGALQSEGTRGYLKNLFGADNSLRSILNNDDWYKAYIRTGGSSAQFLDPIKLFNDSKWSKLNPINKIERINEITEQMPRLAEFKNSLQRMGVTPATATPNQLRRAATAAADVTVNFGRGGSLGRLVNKSFIPFFNPAIQGGDKLIRVVLRDKNAGALFKLATKAAVLGVAPTAVNEMLLADNPHYKDISDRDKMANYYIPLSKDNPLGKLIGSDGEIFLKIPKARALSIGGVLEQKFTNKLPDTSWADIVAFGSDQVGPVGWQNNIFQQILNSQITDNSATGRTWYGSNIETEYDQKDAKGRERAAHKRYDANTSAISIGITKALSKAGVEVSPKKLDYLIDSYTGIAGDVALNATRKAARRGLIASNFTTDSVLQANTQARYYNKLKDPKTSDKELKQMGTWQSRISTVNKSIRALQDSNTEGKAEKVKELTKIRNSLMKKALSGKTNDSATGDMKAIAKVVGNKKAFDLVASEKDKEVLKRYGKADAKFLDSYIAVKELNTGSKSKTATALAIASAGGNKKIAKAFGVNAKTGDDMVSPMQRAKSYLKNGGSIEEYKRLQKAIKNTKDKSNDGYMTKALALARAGASNRAFNLYDIKDYKVQQARNMASLGITQADIAKAKKAADSDGSGRVNKAEAMAYINSLKGDKAKKSVTLEGIYWYARKYGNPYGHVNASAKDATDSKTKAKYGIDKPANSEGEAGPVPLKRGYQTVNGKKKPNGKTIGSIGEKVKLPAGMTADELKANEKLPDGDSRKVKKTTVEERMHNAFGSRIGDTTKKKVYNASMFKKIKKNKDGSSDITFANGEVWHNPVEKKVEDKTKLETSGGGGGGRRGWRRYGRRRGRGGRGGGGGGAAGGAKTLKTATPAPTTKANLTLKGYKKPNPKTIDDKVQAGLTRAQMRALLKRSKVEQATTAPRKRSNKKDVYSVRSSKK